MITGELKNRIDSLWEIFWTGGLTNPLDVIEQMNLHANKDSAFSKYMDDVIFKLRTPLMLSKLATELREGY